MVDAPTEVKWVRLSSKRLATQVKVGKPEAFWVALKYGVLERAETAGVPLEYFSEFLRKPACDLIGVLQRERKPPPPLTPQDMVISHIVVWQGFRRTFELAVDLFGGHPKACPDFRKGFHLSILPFDIQSRILGYLAPGLKDFRLEVCDHASGVTSLSSKRTYYVLEQDRGSRRTTTYTTSSIPNELLAFLTSKNFRPHLKNLQYERGITFNGSPESVSAFMHDRMTTLQLMTKITLNYRFGMAKLSAGLIAYPTKPAAWCKLSNILVHDCTKLKDLIVIVDEHFWNKIKWKGNGSNHYATVTELIRLPKKSSKETGVALDLGDDRPCGFLEKIGRLSNEQVHLNVDIAGADTEEKKFFNMAVNLRLHQCMGERKPLAEDKKKCRCKSKDLRRSCAWDPPEANHDDSDDSIFWRI